MRQSAFQVSLKCLPEPWLPLYRRGQSPWLHHIDFLCFYSHPLSSWSEQEHIIPHYSPSNLPTSIFNSLHNFHQSQTGSHHEMALSPLCISNGVPLLQLPGPFFDLHYCTPFLNFHLLWNVASPAVAKRQKMLENLSGPGSIHWWCGSGLLMCPSLPELKYTPWHLIPSATCSLHLRNPLGINRILVLPRPTYFSLPQGYSRVPHLKH